MNIYLRSTCYLIIFQFFALSGLPAFLSFSLTGNYSNLIDQFESLKDHKIPKGNFDDDLTLEKLPFSEDENEEADHLQFFLKSFQDIKVNFSTLLVDFKFLRSDNVAFQQISLFILFHCWKFDALID